MTLPHILLHISQISPTAVSRTASVPISKDTLFALSLFPYLGFLWFLTRSKQVPKLALVGFYLTLLFVAITIPAGIYAKVHYGEALANVDFLHGGAEFFLTLANIVIVLGFRQAIRQKRAGAHRNGTSQSGSPWDNSEISAKSS